MHLIDFTIEICLLILLLLDLLSIWQHVSAHI